MVTTGWESGRTCRYDTPANGWHPGRRGTDDQEIESLLAAFEDTDCRAIIEATMETALSAKEVAETCDLPLSTAYRKLDELTEVGILNKQIRLSQSGQHKGEYVPKIESVDIDIDGSGISLEISSDQPAQQGHSAVAGAD